MASGAAPDDFTRGAHEYDRQASLPEIVPPACPPWKMNRPMATLHTATSTRPRDGNIVVYCHHGIRSAHAVEMLRAAGVPARNLSGGIDRWSAEVDPSVRRY